jgi:hypothetical protein
MKSAASGRSFALAVAVLLAVTIAPGCGEGEGQGEGAGGEVIVIPPDAIEIVGTSETLVRVQDLIRGPDGTTWVLNSAPPFFVAFDADGGILSESGARGEGPDEFQVPVALAALSSGADAGSIWVYDRGRHAMRRIDGGEGASVPFPREEVAPGRLLSADDGGMGANRVWIRGGPEGFLTAAAPEGMPAMARSLWDADVLLLTREGTIQRQRRVSDHVGSPDARYPGAVFLLPFPLWDRCADGTTILYDPLANALRRLAADGESGPSVALPPERAVQLTPDRLFNMLVPRLMQEVPDHARPPVDELRASFDDEFEEASAQFADVFPEYAAIHCVDEEVVWLQLFDVEEGIAGNGLEWWRIEPWGDDDVNARFTAYRFPSSFTPFRYEGGRAWGVVLDALDVPSVGSLAVP